MAESAEDGVTVEEPRLGETGGWWRRSWVSLSRWGKSRALRTSSIWLFGLPIVARVLNKIDSLEFVAGDKTYTIEIGLPFSWKLLFLSALFFALANFIYSRKCPGIIRLHEDAKAFLAEGRGPMDLSREILFAASVWGQKSNSEAPLLPETIHVIRRMGIKEGPTFRLQYAKDLDNPGLSYPKPEAVFFYARRIANGSSPVARMACTLLYTAGALTGGWILVQNINFVFELW
ncbi:MAG: hypothetical protein O7H41_19685 [Planctomycetota bacterium]|nr:hypothetical protein [Planctomycetota bacterium]